jgi:hypothetical protein
VPAGQTLQSRADVGPKPFLYVLLEFQKVPEGHIEVHVVLRPATDENVPGWHGRQPLPSVAGRIPYEPAPHFVQAALDVDE